MSAARRPFSIRLFSISVLVQYTILLLLFRWLAPTTWSRQFDTGILGFILLFFGWQLFNCFFEWVFHRYILHARIHPWLSRFSRGHRNHHYLTRIQLRPSTVGSDRIILNIYPITEVEQHEDAAFPPYALVAFWLLFAPLFIGVQSLFPHWPVILAGTASTAWSMFAYEVFHAVEHYPYEWWQRATEHPRWGTLWKKIYGFHHFHHANIKTNEAISGFLGLPVADWAFRTYNQPPELLFHGRLATAKLFRINKPWPFVAWLDAWATRREARIVHRSP